MELKYKEALAQYKLEESKLPEDAKVGIRSIGEIMKVMAMLEKKGKKPTEATLKKIKALDKWVYYEILDHVQGTDENEEKTTTEIKAVVAEVKTEAAAVVETTPVKTEVVGAAAVTTVVTEKEPVKTAEEIKAEKEHALGLEIEAELEEMHKSGRKEWDIESVKGIGKKTYALLFDTYKDGEENGVKTSKFSLMETAPKVFTLN